MPLVVDASVAVKWLLPEVHSLAARRILDADEVLLAPDLLWAEVGNVLWKRCRSGDLTRDEVRDLLRDFRRLPVTTVPVKELVVEAMEIAVRFDRSIYNSLYLALAVTRECRLVTADRAFCSILKRTPLAASLCWVEDA
jgi:predicted nucleic acid-binding protein